MEKYTIEKAMAYINTHKHKVDPTYRYDFHVTGELGWINDPNGFSYFDGKYHLFYQYHPYSTNWGPMHWGHVSSKDLVKWQHEKIALAPDQPYDFSGCFSGSGFVHDNKHYLMYTGHQHPDLENHESIRQVQCLAVSTDGVHYEKIKENPVIKTEDLPSEASIQDFRDPKVFKRNDMFYTVIGSRNPDDSGQILLYKSVDLLKWTYVSTILKSDNKLGKMWECPDLIEIDGKDILIVSPQFMTQDDYRYTNVHASLYMVGKLDLDKGTYTYETIDELDAGFDYYAPQTTLSPDGRNVLIAWMRMWDDPNPTESHHWAGGMTFPRALSLKDNKLIQLPVKEIENYYTDSVLLNDVKFAGKVQFTGVEGDTLDLEVTYELRDDLPFGIELFKNSHCGTKITYYPKLETLIFDRTENGSVLKGKKSIPLKPQNNQITLRMLLDKSSVELFINNGEMVLSSTVYPLKDAKAIEFFTEGRVHIKSLKKHRINVFK